MVAALWLISAPILGLLALRWYIRRTKSCPSNMRLDDHTVVITGASSGIGEATAFELARRGGRVILACRDKAKADPVVKKIIKETGNRNIEFRQVDLACQRSIRDFAQEFNEQEHRLDILINNAAYEGPKCKTKDGLERTFGVNHVGHFLLTTLLLPKLRSSSPSRVVILTSGDYSQGELDLQNLEKDGYPDVYKAYTRSKLANIYFTSELNRRFSKDGITTYAVHPGVVSTGLFREFPGIVGLMLRTFSKVLFKSPHQGCQTVVFCAVARGIEKYSGKLFSECHTRELEPHVIDALNQGDGEKLWKLSEDMCHKSESIPSENNVEDDASQQEKSCSVEDETSQQQKSCSVENTCDSKEHLLTDKTPENNPDSEVTPLVNEETEKCKNDEVTEISHGTQAIVMEFSVKAPEASESSEKVHDDLENQLPEASESFEKVDDDLENQSDDHKSEESDENDVGEVLEAEEDIDFQQIEDVAEDDASKEDVQVTSEIFKTEM